MYTLRTALRGLSPYSIRRTRVVSVSELWPLLYPGIYHRERSRSDHTLLCVLGATPRLRCVLDLVPYP